MSNIKIAILNKSSVVSDAEIEKAVPAFQTQISRDFAPVWGIDADLKFFSSKEVISAGYWWCIVTDTSDVDGALGYHELTPEGNPISYVFAKSDLANNLSWTITMSHELLEMLADPNINLTVLAESKYGLGKLYSYEVCDACEDDQFGYEINGVMVSDFVYPAWFESFRKEGSTKFDYKNLIHKPLDLLPGGYISLLDLNHPEKGWHQINAKLQEKHENHRCDHFYRRKNKFKHINLFKKIKRFFKKFFQ